MLAELHLEIFRRWIIHVLSCTSPSYERASPLVHAENQNCTDVVFRPDLVPNSTLLAGGRARYLRWLLCRGHWPRGSYRRPCYWVVKNRRVFLVMGMISWCNSRYWSQLSCRTPRALSSTLSIVSWVGLGRFPTGRHVCTLGYVARDWGWERSFLSDLVQRAIASWMVLASQVVFKNKCWFSY